MIKYILLLLHLVFFTILCRGQDNKRPIETLINHQESAWILVQGFINEAKNKVEILPVDTIKAKTALYNTQVSTRSPMGAIIYHTGGLIIDNGWIRILGSGSKTLTRSLPDWNLGKSFSQLNQPIPYLLIADDVIGGFYLLNGGGLGKDLGKVYYFSPDNLTYEPMDITYTEFLLFCFNTNFDAFYEGYRWKGWQNEVTQMTGDEVFSFFPFLWSKQGKDIDKSTRQIIPIEEQYDFNINTKKELGIE